MAWEKEKNKVLISKKVTVGEDTVIIELYSYDGGEPKIKYLQEIKKKDKSTIIVPAKSFVPKMALKVAIATKKICKEHLGEE